jgi:hypothetical protein
LLVDPPLPEDDDPPELEPVELPELGLEEELEDVAAFATGGEGSGTNGSRVSPWLWKRTPPGVSETASLGLLGATVTGNDGAEPVTEMLGKLAMDVAEELPEEPPVTVYATAAIRATAASATNGSRRREARSERIDCRNSIMALPL